MIKGIGTDIIEIDRIKKALKKRESFINRLFTKIEIEFFKSRNYKVETIAGTFACKEAVSKALGTGIIFSWKDIEILRETSGKPYVRLYDKANEILKEKNASNIQVSISHNKTHAIANCIIE